MNGNTITIAEVMAYLIENCTPNLPANAIAEVFDRLIWCFADNGKGILNVRRDWLSSGDLFKVEVALSMTETFPYDTRDEMILKFNDILKKYPSLKEMCNDIIAKWDEQFKS
jgi:hypothetical protein